MRLHRFYVDLPLAPGQLVELPAAVAHHAVRVLRLRDRATLVLFNNRGSEFSATLSLAADLARAEIKDESVVASDSKLALTLVQSWTASDKLDWIVEKAVELGVHRIVLAPTQRALVQLSGDRLQRRVERLRDIAIAAACQSGRTRLAEITAGSDIESALRFGLEDGGRGILLDPGAAESLVDAALEAGSACAIAIGPEGGFDDQEMALARRLGYGARRLGPRILRTETAGLAALTVIQSIAGDLGS
ncbi:MAG: 16S rRNA (uracil(1498)-N(3))-methyltransferase [Burkholderiaceae bacterium]